MKFIRWWIWLIFIIATLLGGLGMGYFGATRDGDWDTHQARMGFLVGCLVVGGQGGVGLFLLARAKKAESKKVRVFTLEELQLGVKNIHWSRSIYLKLVLVLTVGIAWGIRDSLDPTVSERDGWVLRVCLAHWLLCLSLLLFANKEKARLNREFEKLQAEQGVQPNGIKA